MFIRLVIAVLFLLPATTHAQCANGVCGRPAARIVTGPVRVVRGAVVRVQERRPVRTFFGRIIRR